MRLDSFLAASRIFKTRSLAAEAISSSMVIVENKLAKPSKKIIPQMIIEVDTPRFYKKVQVMSLPPKNMKKALASSLYRLLEERIKD
jgi:ribosome-associated heat shock protein Hsp15